MVPFIRAMNHWTNALQIGWLMTEAQSVVTMRMLGLAGVWSVSPYERQRMLSEKAHAFAKSLTDAQRAAITGQSPDKITAAALKPIRQTARANRKRLAKRGPKKA